MAAEDLARAHAFLLRNDLLGTRTEPFRYGTAVFAAEFPLRHDSNYLLVPRVPRELGAAALAAEAERLQGGAGLGHRCILLWDGAAAERLVPELAAEGYVAHRGVVMAWRRTPHREMDLSGVEEVEPQRLRAAREHDMMQYPWASPEVVRQMLEARARIPAGSRSLATFVDGEAACWVELVMEHGVVQLEALATVERFRRQGHATRVMLRAMDEARRAGARLVFLCADASDWPREFYARLGFDEIGRYLRFTRIVGAARA
jgi:ribosomal protein S18 acetylase RimI-like enzyme